MNVYNDMPILKKAVESIIDQVDKIIAIDGKYSEFEGEPNSTDGTLEYLSSLAKVELYLKPNLTQIEKRNRYLLGSPGDYYFMLDGDEVVQGDIKVPQNGAIGIVKMREHLDHLYFIRAKIFPHVEGIHYANKHYWLFDGTNQTLALLKTAGANYTREELDGFYVEHFSGQRSELRRILKRRYYNISGPRERVIEEWL